MMGCPNNFYTTVDIYTRDKSLIYVAMDTVQTSVFESLSHSSIIYLYFKFKLYFVFWSLFDSFLNLPAVFDPWTPPCFLFQISMDVFFFLRPDQEQSELKAQRLILPAPTNLKPNPRPSPLCGSSLLPQCTPAVPARPHVCSLWWGGGSREEEEEEAAMLRMDGGVKGGDDYLNKRSSASPLNLESG